MRLITKKKLRALCFATRHHHLINSWLAICTMRPNIGSQVPSEGSAWIVRRCKPGTVVLRPADLGAQSSVIRADAADASPARRYGSSSTRNASCTSARYGLGSG